MARRNRFKLDGVDSSEKVPRRIDGASRRFKSELAKKLKSEIRRIMRKDARTGKMMRSVRVRVLGDKIIAGSRHPGIKAQEKGAYIVAKEGALRFRSGGHVQFIRRKGAVRLKPKRWFERAMRNSRVYAVVAFKEAFGRLRD